MNEQTKCPVCQKRLFDIEQYLIGKMRIKCPQCKNVIKLTFAPERVTSTSEAEPHEPSETGATRATKNRRR